MDTFVSRLRARMDKELIFVQGIEAISNERQAAYRRDLTLARTCGDRQRARQIIADMRMFSDERQRIAEKHRSLDERLRRVEDGRGFANPVADRPFPELGVKRPDSICEKSRSGSS